MQLKKLLNKNRSWLNKNMAVLLMISVITTIWIYPAPAVAYEFPDGVGKDLQLELQIKIQSGMDSISTRIETDMNAAIDPLIPTINNMVTTKTKEMGPKINEIGISTIQPSLKSHVEEQTRLVGTEVNGIIMGIVGGGPLQSDPTELIRSKLMAELPRIKQETIDRANQEQIKEMETIKPLIEEIIQSEINALLPEIQKLVQAKLKETVPATKIAVDADIEKLISELQQSLPDDQKQLLVQMRPQFEAVARPGISEELYETVAVKIDQRVAKQLEDDTLASIKSIVVPMNQYCTDFAVSYSKTLLPPQVDMMGIRPQIESMIDESAAANVQVFEERIMAENKNIFDKQADVINEQMHSYVKKQVMTLLAAGTSDTKSVVTAAADSANVLVNGHQLSFDVPPVIVQGRTLVPLRAIFEALGASVTWDPTTRTISANRGNIQITLQPDAMAAYKNAEKLSLDVPATIVNGRTMVPVRFVSESFGALVNWDGNTRTVSIESK